jgi:TPR repeat protein
LATAQHNLAIAYQSGRGVSKDTAMALFWMLIAARAADAAERLVPLLSESETADMVPRTEAWQRLKSKRHLLIVLKPRPT